jgi:inosine-uridine nucleoside N-ribohydrolase
LAAQYRVFRGCGRSLDGEEPSAASVHGRDGLGDAPNRLIWGISANAKAVHICDLLDKLIIRGVSSVERYLQLSRVSNGESSFDLLCTGPLTNLACALNLMTEKEQSSFWRNCRHAVVMGGAFRSRGNITNSAEFNMFADPVAAQVVLSHFDENRERAEGNGAADKRIYFVSLDTTELVAIPVDGDVASNQRNASPAAEFLRYALKQYGLFHVFNCRRPEGLVHSGVLANFVPKEYLKAQLAGGSGDSELKRFCYLHDPLAAWALVTDKCSEEALWKTDWIRIDTSREEGRGRVIVLESKDANSPARVPVYGTEVKWLDPERIGDISETFIGDIASLLGLRMAVQKRFRVNP